MYVCSTRVLAACKGKRGVRSLKLELRTVVSAVWILESEPRSPASLSYWTTF